MNNIKKYFLKNNRSKIYWVLKIMFCIIFALTIILDSAIVFNGDVNAKLEQIHFNKIGLKNVLIGIFIFIITNIFLIVFETISDKIEKNI